MSHHGIASISELSLTKGPSISSLSTNGVTETEIVGPFDTSKNMATLFMGDPKKGITAIKIEMLYQKSICFNMSRSPTNVDAPQHAN